MENKQYGFKRLVKMALLGFAHYFPFMGKHVRARIVKLAGVNVIDWQHTTIGQNCFLDTLHPEYITIEPFASVAMNSTIFTHYYDPSEREKTFKYGKVLLKKGCFVGAGTIICNSVTIGKHSIVGAGSVVTKSIPDYEIWAGNPARFIKIRSCFQNEHQMQVSDSSIDMI